MKAVEAAMETLKINKTAELKLNDAPWPGYTYIINQADTSKVLTYSNGGVVLAEFEGKQSQRWVCHSTDGWLGFANDPGESTVFLGYDSPEKGKLHCKAKQHRSYEMFCVRKRPEDGFQLLMKSEGSLRPMGVDKDGSVAMIRYSESWWGFTKIC
ncbi:hypothetical protein ABW20_dc0106066 [Dactylellina cionopaga]|nr:hypothetical protein ABW20_dc0106066 [Dactylellina cionopaga]